MLIALDFDGTCVKHEFPMIGDDVPGAVPSLRQLSKDGDHFILWTMRSCTYLERAIEWFVDKKIPLIGINSNVDQWRWTGSPKAFADMYIDDAAVGCPLIVGKHARPYVDWPKVMKIIVARKRLEGGLGKEIVR